MYIGLHAYMYKGRGLPSCVAAASCALESYLLRHVSRPMHTCIYLYLYMFAYLYIHTHDYVHKCVGLPLCVAALCALEFYFL